MYCMGMLLRTFGKYLSLSFVALILAAVPAAAESERLRIGAVLALTGPAASWGIDSRRAIELARDDLNARFPQGLEILLEDSASEAARAVTAFKKLVEIDKVDAVIGDVWSHLTIPLIPLADKAHVPLISPSVVPASIDKPGSYFFTLGFKPEKSAAALDQFFRLNPQIKRAAFITWDDPWGTTYLNTWKDALTRHDGTVIATQCNCARDYGYDYRTDVTKIVNLKPDALFAPYHMERILKLLAEQRAKMHVLTTSNIREVFRNGLLPIELAEGVYFTEWPPQDTFVERFRQRFGEPPFIEAFNGYDALMAIAEAAEKNAEDLLSGLKGIRRDGLAGYHDFRHGFAANDAIPLLMQVKGGKVVRVD